MQCNVFGIFFDYCMAAAARDGARVTVVSQLGPLLKESLSIGSPMHFPQDDLFYLITDFVVEWFYSIKEGSSRWSLMDSYPDMAVYGNQQPPGAATAVTIHPSTPRPMMREQIKILISKKGNTRQTWAGADEDDDDVPPDQRMGISFFSRSFLSFPTEFVAVHLLPSIVEWIKRAS